MTIKANYIIEVFRRYMKAQNILFDEVGEAMDCTGQNISRIFNKPVGSLTINQIFTISKIVGCSEKDLFKALKLTYADYKEED